MAFPDLAYFEPGEFHHPDRMSVAFLRLLDRLRARAECALVVTSDARTGEDMANIYGADAGDWPNSAHWGKDGRDAVAVDVVPKPDHTLNRFRVVEEAIALYREGKWENLGIGHYDEHLHLDDHIYVPEKRPRLWWGESK